MFRNSKSTYELVQVRGIKIKFVYFCLAFAYSIIITSTSCCVSQRVEVYNYYICIDWSQTRCSGQVTAKHPREFKEAWHSMDKLT